MEKLIIIGSGPAGHTAAIYAGRALLEPLMFEGFLANGFAAGGQLTTTTDVENFPGFPDGIMGPELMERMRQQSLNSGCRIETKTVDSVTLDSDGTKGYHEVIVGSTTYQTKTLIIASGASAKRLGLTGEDIYRQNGVSACAVCDGGLPMFRNQPLIIIGGGDAAIEEAVYLTKFASKVTMLVRRDEFKASKAMQQRAFANEKIEIMRWTQGVEILGDGRAMTGLRVINNQTQQTTDLKAGGLFYAIGHEPATKFLNGQLELDGAGYIVTKGHMSTLTSVPGVFAAGDVQDHVYRQAITSAGTGCMAALEAERWIEEHKQEDICFVSRSTHMYIPSFSSREEILPQFQALLDEEVTTLPQLKERIARRDALDNQLSDDYAWRYINQSRRTENEVYKTAFMQFIEEIMPAWQRMSDQLNRHLAAFPYVDQLEKPYQVYLRSVKKSIDLFREENIPLQEQDQKLATAYQACRAAMMVTYAGQELTLQQAGKYLEEPDRTVRKEVYEGMATRQLQDKEQIHGFLDELITLRLQQAKNAGYDSYIDYIYAAKGRFDYTPDDVHQFRASIAKVITPLYLKQLEDRKQQLGVEHLFPYDLVVDPTGLPPLRPFDTAEELTQKTITGLMKIDPRFGERIGKLDDLGMFDLASRKAKQPGGYNYPLNGQGVSFVFANVAGTMSDIETMLHECGHALHQRFMEHLPLGIFKEYPSEVAEVASMSMELFSYDMRDQFSLTSEELKRAKQNHLEDIIKTLCRVAVVDEFQHWLYTNPGHSHEERELARKAVYTNYCGDLVDRSAYPDSLATMRQKQLHIFELPFYYIEYAIAQLGAIAMWKHYLADKQQGIDNYTNFLAQGYTCPIPEIFAAGGIRFDFSESYIGELLAVVKNELESLV